MKKVFIVEDEKVLREMYVFALKMEGFVVKMAWNGEGAVQEIKNEKPDLILLDLLLPRINGEQVLENLKNDSETKDIPVFILTNYDTPENREIGNKFGAEKYILKTDITPKEIGEIVKKRLEEIDS